MNHKVTVELQRRVGSRRASLRTTPIIAVVIQGGSRGDDLLAGRNLTDVECAKNDVQSRLNYIYRTPVEIEWLDKTEEPCER